MVYICYGIPKSASSFLYQLTAEVVNRYADKNGLSVISLRDILPADILINDIFFNPTKNFSLNLMVDNALQEAGKEEKCISVKVHCKLTDYVKSLIEEGSVKANASFRHPADCILSFIDAYKKAPQRFPRGQSFESALDVYCYQQDVFLEWAEVQSILLVHYDEIVTQPKTIIQRLCNQVGIAIDHENLLYEYVNNKRQIWEYNKGIVDRRFEELCSNQIMIAESTCAKLVDFIDRYYSLSQVPCGGP